jgi:hypothetical protein
MAPDDEIDAPEARDGAVAHEDDIDWDDIIATTEADRRKSDCVIDHEDDVDWNNIIPTLEADLRSGKCAFVSEVYDTHEEALKAMDAVIDRILQEAINRVRPISILDAGS